MASDKGKKSAKTVTAIPANDDGTEKKRALDIALAGIEKQFGKGAVIRMGERAVRDIRGDSDGLSGSGYGAGRGRRAARPRGGDLRPGILRQDDRRAAHRRGGAEDGRRGRVHRRGARARSRLCAQAGRGHRSSCTSLSRTPASRRWKSARRWCAPARLTSWSSTRWRRSCRRPKSTARWAIRFVGLQARLMSQALRKLTGIINKTNSTCIFINQLREKVGVMYGNPETTAGRHARSSSMRPCASTSAAASSSRTAQPSSATARRRRSSRTRSRRRSEPRSSIFSTARASARKAACWTCAVALDIIHKSGAWFSYE